MMNSLRPHNTMPDRIAVNNKSAIIIGYLCSLRHLSVDIGAYSIRYS